MCKIKDTAKKTKRILTNETVKFLFAHKSFLIVILYPLLPDFIPVLGELDDILVIVWQVCNILTNEFEATPAYMHASANSNKLSRIRQGTEIAAEAAAMLQPEEGGSKEEVLDEAEASRGI